MRFLVDECTGPAVARWLRDQSHQVFSVYEEARLMWRGTRGQRFWRLLGIRMAAGWLLRWRRTCDELKLLFGDN